MTILRLALTGKALFDLTDACLLFRSHSDLKSATAAFDQEMISKKDIPLPPGPMLPIIMALQTTGLVQFGLFSKISPEASIRVRNSLKHYGITLSEEHYTNGAPAYPKAGAYHIYYGGDEKEAKAALEQNVPAVYILPSLGLGEITTLKLAIDFDNFAASDQSDRETEKGKRSNEGLKYFHAYEDEHKDMPLPPSIFTPAVKAFSDLRMALKNEPQGLQLVMALVTSRGDINAKRDNSLRVHKTLQEEKIFFDEFYFMDGNPKGPAVLKFGAHMFLDDGRHHCDNVVEHVGSVIACHAWHGITNERRPAPPFFSPLHYIKPALVSANKRPLSPSFAQEDSSAERRHLPLQNSHK